MMRKKGISLLLSVIMCISLTACSAETVETTGSSKIELIEPVNMVANVEKAMYRNLYNCEVYSAMVYPTVTEYSFAKNAVIDGTGAFWGDEVKKGDVLVYGNTEELDKKIEELEEQIENKAESMQETLENLNESLEKPREEEKWLKGVVEAYEKVKPEEKIPACDVSGSDAAGSDVLVDNPAYTTWYAEAVGWIGRYEILKHNINMQEENYRQQEELYQLEREYMLEKLQALKNDKNKSSLRANEDGVVVAKVMGDNYGEMSVQAEQELVAVGNMEQKVLKCDYINDLKVAAADDMYALIDGIRYEIEYHPISREEYTEITESGSKVYTTFTILGDTEKVEVGDFAVICVFSDKKENVLSVPKEAIHKDGSENFVYLMQNGESVAQKIKTGMTDGVYTEVLSGLNEGDEVMVENDQTLSGKTATVTYGSFHGTFEERGKISGAMGDVITNPVEHGTTYFGEYQVEYLQHVNKGDVIATVRVAKDEITIKRLQQSLLRATQRLEDLKAAGEEENKKAIESRQEEIAELKKQLAEVEADGEVTEIRATRSGMIVGMSEYEKETILYHDAYIADIADEESMYISVADENGLLNYGEVVNITYTTYMREEKSCKGMVATLAPAGVSRDLQTGSAMIKVPKEDLPDMMLAIADDGNWRNPQPYRVKTNIREMENVLVVPRGAVTEVNGHTYVRVKDEQGNVKVCSFVAGGYDSTNYWIVEGLSEGMIVCLK
ncbi:MAG: hypothetical protein IKK33_06155 [Lachnospiraceae bacterium]|nr:hypothetical protein [Lachnospiraceae bacterium]